MSVLEFTAWSEGEEGVEEGGEPTTERKEEVRGSEVEAAGEGEMERRL